MISLTRKQFHHYFYIACLMTIAIALPLSNYAMSVGGVLLLVNAVLQWDWKSKWERIRSNKCLVFYLLFFLSYAIGWLHADNFQAALDAMLNRLPLLIAPLVIASSELPTKRQYNAIIHVYLASVLFATIYSIVFYITNTVEDIREISRFISHIRFSLSIVLSMVFAAYYSWLFAKQNKFLMCSYLLLMTWLFVYLIISQTLTGICILFLLLVVLFFYLVCVLKNTKIRKRILFFSALPILIFVILFVWLSIDYFCDKDRGAPLLEVTENGSPYYHSAESMIENGHRIFSYVAYDELPIAWQKRSSVPYDEVEPTLIRYLNSLGWTKDSASVARLSLQQVGHIEQKIANVEYAKKFGLKKNIYATFFSISAYSHYRQVENSSLLQRVELWRNSCLLFYRHFWWGVGIGDHKAELDKELQRNQSPLMAHPKKGCHNQFLTIGISSGIFALLAFLMMLFAPFFVMRGKLSPLYVAFFIILFVSMFTEDTLDTSAGVFLFALFNALLLFVQPNLETNSLKKDLKLQS